WLLDQVEEGNLIQDLKMNILQVIQINDSVLDGFINALSLCYLSNAMNTNEFFMISNKNIVYEIPADDQIIKKLAYTFKTNKNVKTIDKSGAKIDDEDDNVKIITVSSYSALNNLENIHNFLLQQKGSSEQFKLVNSLEKFIKAK
ncbi:2418_t:CDS:2, partial [Cetraspora pellucida]